MFPYAQNKGKTVKNEAGTTSIIEKAIQILQSITSPKGEVIDCDVDTVKKADYGLKHGKPIISSNKQFDLGIQTSNSSEFSLIVEVKPIHKLRSTCAAEILSNHFAFACFKQCERRLKQHKEEVEIDESQESMEQYNRYPGASYV